MPSTLGDVTRVVFFEEPEPGKIHVEFEALAAVRKGQQVKIDPTSEKVTPIVADEPAVNVIGVAVMSAAIGERVTIATRGYCVVIAQAGAAINAGPVKAGAYDAGNDRPTFAADATQALVLGWNLDFLGAAGEHKVLLK